DVPDVVRPFRTEFRLYLPHGHPARRNLLENLRFDVAVNGAENRDEFGDFANDLDSIQSIDAQDIRSGRYKFLFPRSKEFPGLTTAEERPSLPLDASAVPSMQRGRGCEEILKDNGGVRRSFTNKVITLSSESKFVLY